jgi:lysyl-tRNA synthetase class 2
MLGDVALGLVLAVVASVAVNTGFLVQHAAARGAPAVSLRRPVASLIALARSRRWTFGVALGLAGWAVEIAAFSRAPLSLVQAFFAGGLALAAPIAVLAFGQRLRAAEWIAILVMAAGLGGLSLTVGHVAAQVSFDARGLALFAASAGVVGALVAVTGGRRRALSLGVASGIFYGAADAAIKALTEILEAHGALGVVTSPWLGVAVLASLAGCVAFQRGLQVGHGLVVIALSTAGTVLVAVVAGLSVFGDSLGAGAGSVTVHVVALLAVIGASLRLAPCAGRPKAPGAPAPSPRATTRSRRRGARPRAVVGRGGLGLIQGGRLARVAAAGAAVYAGLTTLTAALSPGAIDHAAAASLPLHMTGIAGGAGLLVIAHGLWVGRRRAALVAVGALSVLAAVRVAVGLGVIDGGIDAAVAVLLAANLRAFARGAGRPGRAARHSATLALVAAGVAYAAYAAAALSVHRATDMDDALTAAGNALAKGAWALPAAPGLIVAVDVPVLVALAAGVLFLRALLRPEVCHEGHPCADHRRAAEIVARYAADSLDAFSLREDKAFHFAAGGFVAYRVLRETAVISGDPIGPPGAAPAIVESFLELARRRDWNVVATAVSARHLAAYRELGLHALCVGEEAIVDPRRFTLEGRAVRKLRQSVNRLAQRGWRHELIGGDELSPTLLDELGAVEARWRSGQSRLQGFAMTLGRLWGGEEDRESLYVIARNPAGELRAFLRFVRFPGGLSLDVMRRLGDAPNGLTEALVAHALEHARERGLGTVSLNFAGFAQVMAADATLTRSQRVLRAALRLMHGRFQLERLVCFDEKFSPDWQPRYLLYGGLSQLPLAALRVLQAEAYLRCAQAPPLSERWEPQPLPLGASATLASPRALR